MIKNRLMVKLPYGAQVNFPDEALVFTHIPKTAGTSLHNAFGEALGDHYSVLTALTAKEIDFETIHGIGGHQPFGSTPISTTTRHLVHITIFRDPIDRFLSFYRHVISKPNHQLTRRHPELKEMQPLEFAHFLKKNHYSDIDNLQCYMIAGNNASPTAENAIATLKSHFSVYGTIENLDLFLIKIQTLLGVVEFDMPTDNVSTGSKVTMSHEYKRELKMYLHKVCSEDFELYEFVKHHEAESYRYMR